jgi:hypothetical protein
VLARQRLTFEYDHLGRRVRKRFVAQNGPYWSEQRVTTYLYDGWNLVAEFDGKKWKIRVFRRALRNRTQVPFWEEDVFFES